MLCAGLTVYSPPSSTGVGPGSCGSGRSRTGWTRLFRSAIRSSSQCLRDHHLPLLQQERRRHKDGCQILLLILQLWLSRTSESKSRSDNLHFVCEGHAHPRVLGMLDIGGTMVYVGILEGDLPSLKLTLMIGNNAALRRSNTGSKKELLRMLQLAVRRVWSVGLKLCP